MRKKEKPEQEKNNSGKGRIDCSGYGMGSASGKTNKESIGNCLISTAGNGSYTIEGLHGYGCGDNGYQEINGELSLSALIPVIRK